MPFFSLKYNPSDMQHAIRALGAKAPNAIARATNRAAVTTRTYMARQISADLKLKVGTVREQLRIEEARPSQTEVRARIIGSGKRIPLYDFNARQTKRGVTANTGGGRKVYRGAFIARMRSGHMGVFQRRGKKRLPIDEKFGASLPHVFAKHAPEGAARGEESLQKNLAHELQFALR